MVRGHKLVSILKIILCYTVGKRNSYLLRKFVKAGAIVYFTNLLLSFLEAGRPAGMNPERVACQNVCE